MSTSPGGSSRPVVQEAGGGNVAVGVEHVAVQADCVDEILMAEELEHTGCPGRVVRVRPAMGLSDRHIHSPVFVSGTSPRPHDLGR